MRQAMLYPGNGKNGGDRKSDVFETSDLDECGFSASSLARARYIWHKMPKAEGERHPQLAKDVANGLKTLTDAYKEAQEYVKAEAERRRKAEEETEKRADLEARYPDLAALVAEDKLSLSRAIAAAEQADREAREEADRIRREEEARLAEEERQRLEEERKREEIEKNIRLTLFESFSETNRPSDLRLIETFPDFKAEKPA